MIKAVKDGINPDKYIFDTGLDFGKDFGKEILELAKTNLALFPKRYNYNKADNPKELAREIGLEKAKELYRRIKQMNDANADQTLIQFSQHFFPEELGSKLISTLPENIKNKLENTPSPILQVSKDGDFLGTHKGHKRTSSLFMLLQGSGQETRWYDNKEEFEVIDPLRIPDLDKIEHVVSAVIQPWKWYVFNHYEWHSVHNFNKGSIRINMGLDFNDLSAEELVNMCKKQN